jgi:DNA anti-recombination protein RmuC
MAINFNDILDRALTQARELQRQAGEAATEAAEQIKPQIERSLKNAREVQEKLARHAEESGELAASQTQTAIGYVNDFIRMGSEALRESVEQTRTAALKMAEQSKKIVEQVQAAATGERGASGDPGGHAPSDDHAR